MTMRRQELSDGGDFRETCSSGMRNGPMTYFAKELNDQAVQDVDGGDEQERGLRITENRRDNQSHGHDSKRGSAAVPVDAFEIVVAHLTGHQKSKEEHQQHPDQRLAPILDRIPHSVDDSSDGASARGSRQAHKIF